MATAADAILRNRKADADAVERRAAVVAGRFPEYFAARVAESQQLLEELSGGADRSTNGEDVPADDRGSGS